MEIKQSQTIPLPRVEVSVFVLGFFSCQGVTFSKKVATTFLSKKCNKSHILFPSSEGLGVGSLGSAFSMKSTTLDYPPLNPLPRVEVSVFVLGFFSCQGVTFSKKVATTFLSKKCNKSHILFPSSEGLGVGSLGSAFSMKSTTLDYPPLNPLPRGEVFVIVLRFLVVRELRFQKGCHYFFI